jgi:hypothetical protein
LNIPNEREKESDVAKGTIWVFLPHTKIDTSVPDLLNKRLCGFVVLTATFNNNLDMSWWSGLLVEETGENYRHVTYH